MALISIWDYSSAGEIDDPKQRFLQVTALILAGWHIKPRGLVWVRSVCL